jgi:hypothetical protein
MERFDRGMLFFALLGLVGLVATAAWPMTGSVRQAGTVASISVPAGDWCGKCPFNGTLQPLI